MHHRIFIYRLFQSTSSLTQHMDHSKKGTSRYNKVNQQKKFYLLTLIYKRHMPVRDAAQIVGINYLTAKTIVFFYKNNHKTYQFDIQNTHHHTQATNYSTAAVVSLKKINSIQEKLNYPKSRIEVICSIGNILSPPAGTYEREGPPEYQLANTIAPIQTLPIPPTVSHAYKAIPIWPISLHSDNNLPKGQGLEGKFCSVDGEADRTRVLY